MTQKNIIDKIGKFHKNYEADFLTEIIKNKTNYLKSPRDALFFILSYSFLQGRTDELSERFEKRANKALRKFLLKKDILLMSSKLIENAELEQQYRELYELLRREGVNKRGDRLMVISVINFIQSCVEKNILQFLIQEIKSKKISAAYKKLDTIFSIGPKISSLILRDIVSIYKLGKILNKEDYCYLQPIDTWVHRISKTLGLVHENNIYINEPVDIVNKCFALGVDPIQYNQGAWYVGANSLEILLKNITKII